MIIRDKIRLFTDELMELEKTHKCDVYVKERDTRTFDVILDVAIVKSDEDDKHLCTEYSCNIVHIPDPVHAARTMKDRAIEQLRLEVRKPDILEKRFSIPPVRPCAYVIPSRHAGMRATAMFIDEMHNYRPAKSLPKIKDVIYNGPATIVLWGDNTKTVVKAQEGDEIDYEKGLAMAISKKALGNKGNYCEIFKQWGYIPDPRDLMSEEKKLDKLKKLFPDSVNNRFMETK